MNNEDATCTKNYKKLRKRQIIIGRRLKFILLFILISIFLILLALSPIFNIRNIEVRGNRHYKSEDIINTSGIIKGINGFKIIGSSIGNILLLRDGYAEQALQKYYPYIKKVVVKYKIPGKIEIDVIERDPLCIVPFLGTNLVMDREGYIVDTVENLNDIGLPQVRGLKFKEFKLGQALNPANPEVMYASIKVIDLLLENDRNDEFKIMKLVNYIDASDLKRIILSVDSRIIVNIGDQQDLNYKINFLKQIYSKNLKKDDRGYLDFTNRKYPSFIPQN